MYYYINIIIYCIIHIIFLSYVCNRYIHTTIVHGFIYMCVICIYTHVIYYIHIFYIYVSK